MKNNKRNQKGWRSDSSGRALASVPVPPQKKGKKKNPLKRVREEWSDLIAQKIFEHINLKQFHLKNRIN
jgi:hypothetical protein